MVVLVSLQFEELFGSAMQLLSIECLSLAAEATAVLLLLAFAWPQRKTSPILELEYEKAMNWGPAKFYFLQTCVHRGLYLQQWRKTQNEASPPSAATKPFVFREVEDDENSPQVPVPWQDRLTHLLNRQGFDAVLDNWLSIEPKHRRESCMSMLTLSEYSDLVTTHGAMVTEQALQRIAAQLGVELSAEALVARYLPDRFVILHFASGPATCHSAMEVVHQRISEDGFFKVASEPLSLACNICIVALGSESDAVSKMNELEEGEIEADQSGRSVISRVQGDWTHAPPSMEEGRDAPKANQEKTPKQETAEPSHLTLDSSQTVVSVEHSQMEGTTLSVDNEQEVEDNDSSVSNDLSAVANADDIAALFKEMNANKSSKSPDSQKPADISSAGLDAADATKTIEAMTPVAAKVDPSDAATIDDIANLVASVKSAIKPLETSAATVL